MIRRILAEKRPWVLLIGAAVVIEAVAALVLIQPLSGQVADASSRQVASVRNLRAAEQDLRLARETVAAFDQAKKDLAHFYAAVLPADLNAAGRLAYLRLAQMARESNLNWDRRSFNPEHLRESDLDVLRMSMALEGDYGSVRRFVHSVETAPEFIVIDQVALGTGRDPQGPLALTLELSTYFKAGPRAR